MVILSRSIIRNFQIFRRNSIKWHLYPRVKGDTPIVSSVYQLSNEELFDESTRPNEEQREELKEKIKNEIVRLLSR